MNILWLTRKDQGHPDAGGAEVISHALRQRLGADGHRVTLLTCGYSGASRAETVDGIRIIRVGSNRYLHPMLGLLYYLRHLRNRFDLVVEEVNVAPYLSVLCAGRSKRLLLYHHLEREVWLREAKPPINYLCYYLLEPLITRLLGHSGVPLITVSESTRQELARYGFPLADTRIISEGIDLQPVANLEHIKKYEQPTLLSLGSIRPMKRTLEQIQAFELAKSRIPDLRLNIAGNADCPYGRKVLAYAAHSQYAADIHYLGHVSHEEKIELMQRCHLITLTSIKEGWGLVVTEAASQGTPSVAYNVPGLRDSVQHAQTGLLTETHPAAMAASIVTLLRDEPEYERLRHAAWEHSKSITFAQSYHDFKLAAGLGRV